MKMNKLFKKYGLLFLLGILTLGVLITTIVVLSNSEDMKSYKGKLFSISYDSTWKVKSKKDNILELVHRKSKSSLVIEETLLQDSYQYSVIDDLIDELSYSISNQNKKYKLLSKAKTKVGKDNSDGYKLLFEDDKNQIMVVITKAGANLRLFTYSAKYEYFDMVLDSASSIMESYESTEGKTGTEAVNVKTSKITWGTNETLKNLANKVTTDEIANNNFKVVFEVPDGLEKSSVSTTSLGYYYNGFDLSLYTGVFSKNIFEYVNSKDGGVYSQKESFKKKPDKYSNIKDTLELQEIDGKKRYVYRMTYDYKYNNEVDHMEYIIILYELDKNHVVRFLLETEYVVPKEFVDSIKVKSFENYANNVVRKIEDGKLIGELKVYKESKSDVVEVVKIKLPVEYIEEDHKVDMYSDRYYGKNYHEEYFYYDYYVQYDYIASSEKLALDNVNTTYGYSKSNKGYQNLRDSGTINLNNREFRVFDGGYYESVFSVVGSKDVFVNVKYLVCHIGKQYLVIELKGSGVQISNEVLNEITNFEVEERKEKR